MSASSPYAQARHRDALDSGSHSRDPDRRLPDVMLGSAEALGSPSAGARRGDEERDISANNARVLFGALLVIGILCLACFSLSETWMFLSRFEKLEGDIEHQRAETDHSMKNMDASVATLHVKIVETQQDIDRVGDEIREERKASQIRKHDNEMDELVKIDERLLATADSMDDVQAVTRKHVDVTLPVSFARIDTTLQNLQNEIDKRKPLLQRVETKTSGIVLQIGSVAAAVDAADSNVKILNDFVTKQTEDDSIDSLESRVAHARDTLFRPEALTQCLNAFASAQFAFPTNEMIRTYRRVHMDSANLELAKADRALYGVEEEEEEEAPPVVVVEAQEETGDGGDGGGGGDVGEYGERFANVDEEGDTNADGSAGRDEGGRFEGAADDGGYGGKGGGDGGGDGGGGDGGGGDVVEGDGRNFARIDEYGDAEGGGDHNGADAGSLVGDDGVDVEQRNSHNRLDALHSRLREGVDDGASRPNIHRSLLQFVDPANNARTRLHQLGEHLQQQQQPQQQQEQQESTQQQEPAVRPSYKERRRLRLIQRQLDDEKARQESRNQQPQPQLDRSQQAQDSHARLELLRARQQQQPQQRSVVTTADSGGVSPLRGHGGGGGGGSNKEYLALSAQLQAAQVHPNDPPACFPMQRGNPLCDAGWMGWLGGGKIEEVSDPPGDVNSWRAFKGQTLRYPGGHKVYIKWMHHLSDKWAMGINELAAYHLDRHLALGRTLPVRGRLIREDELPLFEDYKSEFFKKGMKKKWDLMYAGLKALYKKGKMPEAVVMPYYEGEIKSVHPVFCTKMTMDTSSQYNIHIQGSFPNFCLTKGYLKVAKDEKEKKKFMHGCQLEYGESSDVLVFDYLLDNTDRGGNCFSVNYQGRDRLMYLDNESGRLSPDQPYPWGHGKNYPSVKWVHMRDIIKRGPTPTTCAFRCSTVARLRSMDAAFVPRNQTLTERLRQSLSGDPLARLSTSSLSEFLRNPKYWTEMERRMKELMQYVEKCIDLYGNDVLLF